MYYYFSSDEKCAIKINGTFFGIINDQIKMISSKTQPPFVEICPINSCQSTVNFLLDENFFLSPPPNIVLTDLKGGYLIKYHTDYKTNQFAIINQQKFASALVTVFYENQLKLTIETPLDFYAQTINLLADSAEINQFKQNGCDFISVFIKGNKSTLLIYSISQKITNVFCKEIDEYSLDNSLCTVETYCDNAKHKVTRFWSFQNNAFEINKVQIERDKNFCANNLSTYVLPYAFLEELLLSCEIDDFLSENMLKNKDKIKDYLGCYIGVMPPPSFRDINEVGLIFSKSNNFYSVEYLTFEFENNKISNIKKLDF